MLDVDPTPLPGSGLRPVRAAVFGASGAAGAELVRILDGHPLAEISHASSRQYAGESLRAVEPGAPEVELEEPSTEQIAEAEVVFSCLPHGSSAPIAAEAWRLGVPVIDLSGDLRLADPAQHREVYGSDRDPQVAAEAVYGLCELNREALRGARVIANPGCYPTCVALALAPLAETDHLRGAISVDAKSGVSGAGRAATATNHFCSAAEDVRPYEVGRVHRHVPEMEQTLESLRPNGSDPEAKLVFTPHLVPLVRGMLATIVVTELRLTGEELFELYRARYADEPFVELLPLGEPARILAAVRSNRAVIGLSPVPGCDAAVITCAIDNLLKGAAGQAIQNFNLSFGWAETTGLERLAA